MVELEEGLEEEMTAVNEMQNSQQETQNENMPPETEAMPESSDKLQKLAKLLVDKGVITESEFDLLFWLNYYFFKLFAYKI